MAGMVSEFAIAIGLDSSELSQGLADAKKQVSAALGAAADGLKDIGEAGKTSSAAAASGLSKATEGVKDLGEEGTKAASALQSAFGGLGSIFADLKGKIAGVGSVLGLMAGGVKAFDEYVEKADKLSNLSRDLGISAQELDAWGKANEAAGGSADALFGSLKTYYEQTGRPAEEFFKLGTKIEGMSKRQAQAYLRAQGVAQDAIPVFLEGQQAADKLVAKYRKTAFTQQDAKNASNFKTAWMDFKIAAQDVGNVFVRAVIPTVTKALGLLDGLITVVRENIRFCALFAAGLLAAYGVKQIDQIKAAIAAVKSFGKAMLRSMAPVLAAAAAVAAFALAIDDLIGFAEGTDSVFGDMLKSLGMTDAEVEEVRASVQGFIQGCKDLWEALKPIVGEAVKMAFKSIGVAIGLVAAAIVGVIAGITALIDWVKDVKKRFDDFCVSAREYLTELDAKLESIGKAIGKALSEAWDSVLAFFTDFGKQIQESVIEPFSHAFDGIKDALSKAFDSAWDIVKGFFGRIKDLILDNIAAPVKDAFKGVADFFGFGGDDKKDTPQNFMVQDPRAREAVAAQHGLLSAQGASVNTNANVNVNNSFYGYKDPGVISQKIGGSMDASANRTVSILNQASRGVDSK